MTSPESTLRRAAVLIAAASLLGPGAVFVDAAVRRPGPWSGPESFLASFHWTQTLGPLLGFPLLFGFVLFVAGALRLDEQKRVDPIPVILLTAIYGALVTFNYVANAFYVAQSSDPGAVSVLSMENPRSLCWAIEMVAYALLGVVTWLLAPIFDGALALLLRVNGAVSVGSAVFTFVRLTWVLTPVGLGFYAAWNLLLVVIMGLVLWRFRAAPLHARA